MELTPAAQQLLTEPLTRRLQYVRRRRRIRYANADRFLSRTEHLHHHQYEHRSLCLSLTGEQWYGKTTLLHWLHDQALRQPGRGVPSLRIDVTAQWTLTSLYNACLKGLGQPIGSRGDPDFKLDFLRDTLAKKKTSLIIMDEFHDVRRCQPRQLPVILSGLRALCNLPGITVVIAGLPEVENTLRNDPQLSSRFERHQLTRWKEGPEYYAYLAAMLSDFPLPHTSELLDPDSTLGAKLLHLGRHRLGAFSIILCEAACLTLEAQRLSVSAADIQRAATQFWNGHE
ncbi:TniB family NTP-binding protein [Deinococcus soli (ex Cha et al. 2016)]|uniref:TniB family NTP-binding protein n=1 Tax=Deinococcus soli (ex Cha et al. 2016) TaxID=1309411 RepID=UPI00166B85B7|nr:TniB family NTP-binding protein [Deinococcus soli (ex Cha et al. 2016)]GGB84713.1 hypothetical protein GCM10008019_45870 [Deinococcus soli (ex Cha et al. 2016)]